MIKSSAEKSDQELVAGCVRNDRYSQELLYRRYFPTMLRMCLRYTTDRETALEIINNGFLRVFKKIDTFSFNGSLEGWIRRIVFHCLSDYFRQKTQPVPWLDLEGRDAPTRSTALSNLYMEDVLRLVDRLPNISREVFQLFAIEGYTHAEIGKMLDMSEGTSKWHLAMARKQLKELINRHHHNNQNYAG